MVTVRPAHQQPLAVTLMTRSVLLSASGISTYPAPRVKTAILPATLGVSGQRTVLYVMTLSVMYVQASLRYAQHVLLMRKRSEMTVDVIQAIRMILIVINVLYRAM